MRVRGAVRGQVQSVWRRQPAGGAAATRADPRAGAHQRHGAARQPKDRVHSRDASAPRRGAAAVDQARAGHVHPRAGTAGDGDVVVRGGAAVGEPDAGDDHVHGRFDDDESAEEPDERVQAEVQGESAGGGEGGGGGE